MDTHLYFQKKSDRQCWEWQNSNDFKFNGTKISKPPINNTTWFYALKIHEIQMIIVNWKDMRCAEKLHPWAVWCVTLGVVHIVRCSQGGEGFINLQLLLRGGRGGSRFCNVAYIITTDLGQTSGPEIAPIPNALSEAQNLIVICLFHVLKSLHFRMYFKVLK